MGDLPVRLTPDPASSVPAPQQLQVSVTDQSEAQEAGVPVLLRLDRLDDGLTRSRVRIEVDYSGFRAVYGADWASRLRLVRMKPCVGGQAADTTACGVDTVLPSSNDTNPGVVSAALDLATLTDAGTTSANPGGGEAVADAVLALSAGTDSETGSFAKTSLSESSAWQAGQSSGDFGYSYPLELPAAPSDLAPEVTFGYSSGSVDGRTNAESGQTSWLGEGWNYEPGYVERSYRSCKDDQLPAPTFSNATGDLCWREENATLVWQGRSTELIRDSATATWRLAEDDGSRIELLQNGVDWNDALNVFSPGDFDGDGHADVMLRYASNLNLYLLRGDGAGGFLNSGKATLIASMTGANLVFSPGDFTGDGNVDVLWRRSSDGTLWMLRGNGTGGWLSGTSLQIGSFSGANATFGHGDFNGDGKVDVLWRRSSDSALMMIRGNGTGGWITGQSELIGSGWGDFDQLLSPGDFTGDGKVDVLVRHATTKNLYLFAGDGTGGWLSSSGTQVATGPSTADVVFSGGDHDGDSEPDVLWRDGTSKDLFLLAGNGTGGWKAPATSVNISVGLRHQNGDDNGEHWRLTTPDGVQYYFGRDRLPGWVSLNRETNSVWTVPVFGNSFGEPCYRSAGFTASRCSQAWRWNLDHVVDPHQNAMTYWYDREQARTGLANNASSTAIYERGGNLRQIEYGLRVSQEITGNPHMRVMFEPEDRCLTSCWSGTTPNVANWPDTPWDLHCATSATSCAGNISPSFFTTKRLAKVTAQVWNGTARVPVDEWTLTHQFPATGEASVSPALWLSTIVRTGKDGGDKALPRIDFGGTRYANRTDHNVSAGVPLVNRYRITRVSDEHGGETTVTYQGSDCTVSSQAAPSANPKRCFPQYYYPPLAPAPGWSWWNKYRVSKVVDKDLVGGSPDVEQSYDYSTNGSSSTVLWHHSDGAATWSTPLEKRSWSDFRGWPTVTVTTGVDGQTRSQTRSLYFRGMDEDRTDAGEGLRDAKITNSLGEVTEDHSHLAGMLHEEIEYDGAGGIALSKTITTPWQHRTAHRQSAAADAQPSNAYAYYTESATTREMTWLAGSSSWRTTRSVNTYETTYGSLTRTEDLGDVAVTTDDTCTTVQYARNPDAWLIDFPSETTTTNCAATPGPADTLTGSRTYYDGSTTLGEMGSRGLPTRSDEMSGANGSTPTWLKRSTATYDALGRLLTETDALDETTTIAYTPASGGRVTSVSETNPKSQTTTATLNLRGLPVTVTDANNKTTTTSYDPLGRQLKVWLPGRTTSDVPNQEFVYGTDSPSVAHYLQTKTLGPNGNQISAFEIYDGHLRLRQTQATAPDGKRVISDVRYDSRGLVVKESAFYNNASAPTGTLVTFADADVPTQRRYVYDGTEDLTRDALWSLNAEKWHTTITYDGDRTNVDPPAGGIPTTTIEDALGRTTAFRQYHGTGPSGTHDETTYAYDRLDQLTAVTKAGNTWTHTYDRLGRLTATDDPDAGDQTFGYDANDQLVTSTDGRGEVLHRSYDELGRLTALRDDNATGALRASWVYDNLAKGYPTSATRHHTSGNYVRQIAGYTDLYQPSGVTDTIPASQGLLAGTYTTGYGYHPDGTLATTDLPAKGGLPAETVTGTYTDQGYLSGVSGLSTYLASAQYHWHGALKQQTLGSGTKRTRITTTIEDATGRLTKSEVHTENQITPDTWVERLTEQYSYDADGNVLGISETSGTTVVANQCFGYDYLQRLTEAWTTTAGTCQANPSQAIVGGADAYWHSYTYDTAGNRATDTRHSAGGDTTRTYTYPAPGSARPHAVTGITTSGGGPTTSYTYDNGGFLATRTGGGTPNQTLTYDAEGLLAQLTNGTTVHTYLYDAEGGRLIVDNPGTEKILYLGESEYRLSHTTGQVTATRYYPNAVRTTTDGLTWMAANHHGTTQLAIDSGDLSVTRRRMTPFGENRGAPPGTWPDDKGFVGGTIDPTGYTHLGAREYDPATGRFLSVDPLVDYGDPQSLNAYSYSGNNPVRYSDPDGLRRIEHAGGGAGGGGGARGSLGGGFSIKPSSFFKWVKNRFRFSGRSLKGSSHSSSVTSAEMRAMRSRSMKKSPAKKPSSPTSKGKSPRSGSKPKPTKSTKPSKSTSNSSKSTGKPSSKGKVKNAIKNQIREEIKETVKDEVVGGLPPCGHSFAPDTEVLLADGDTRRIDEIAEGDQVLAHDPETGETSAEVVTDLHVNRDAELTDLSVRTEGGEFVTLETTENHPFWSESRQEWVDAGELRPTELLKTSTGEIVSVAKVHTFLGDATMHDLTVANVHTYYVLASVTAVLVHNCNDRTHDKARGAEGVAEMTSTLERFHRRSDIYSESYGNGFELWTPYGVRQVDIAVRNRRGGLDLFEVKVNKSNYTKGQRRKDLWLEQTYGFKTTVLRRSTACPICLPRFP
ncbi:FG-GAP-like repeat-containing protein [Micromonospora sp. NBRC 101691]|uniref:FG-GAP-like repeat-containing protein n=1 Tax=Micromonospora sp. NBRC 101691 TaxID=3032198 RepID=UPI0025526FEA|nr:FG-GAP-like repeat-containing protein [Micromonospora sp. NBRC 101691]